MNSFRKSNLQNIKNILNEKEPELNWRALLYGVIRLKNMW